MNKEDELLLIKEKIRVREENERREVLSQSNGGEVSPTSIRLSLELREKAKKLAYKRNNKTEISQLLKDLLIEALRKEGLLWAYQNYTLSAKKTIK